MMVGSELQTPKSAGTRPGDVAPDISGLSMPSPGRFGTAMKNIHLDLRRGETPGIGGVAGYGQDGLLLALSGEVRVDADAIRLGGRPVGQLGPDQRRAAGFLCTSGARLGHAATPDMSLTGKRPTEGLTVDRICLMMGGAHGMEVAHG